MPSIVVAFLLAATSDSSGTFKAEHNPDELGNGAVIELDVFSLASGPTAQNRFSVAAIGGNTVSLPTLVIPAVQVGLEIEQNALLLGLQLWTVQNSSTEVSIPLTYRRYFNPLVAHGFSSFVELTFSPDIIIPSGGGSLQFGFGADVGFGGEYLFTKNFGLMGKALLGFQHIPAAFFSAIGGSDINAFGIAGVLGILVHI
jgi:hypothetical protein